MLSLEARRRAELARGKRSTPERKSGCATHVAKYPFQSELSLDAASRLDLVDRQCRKRLNFFVSVAERLCPW